MFYLIYFNLRLIIVGVLLTLGAVLFGGVIPSKLRGSIFDSSRKFVGLAIMAVPISSLVLCCTSLTLNGYNLNTALYLTMCYMISVFAITGFISLLGSRFNFRHKRYIRVLTTILFFPSLMILAYIYGTPQHAEMAKTITAVFLMIVLIYQSFVYHKYYKDAVRRGNNYYSEDIQVDISWINKSVFAFFSLEMICAISTFFPNMCFAAELTLSVYKAITILCVFHQFLNFIKHIDVMASVYSEPEIEDIEPEIEESYYKSLTIEQYAQIGKCLDKWVGDKGYTKCGVTIKDVATAVATNRTYLSVYINTTYGCSFKVWITSMRIKRAKQLLMGEHTTVYISQKVGFSSPKSFMHAFKRSEGETPTQWRNTNKTT